MRMLIVEDNDTTRIALKHIVSNNFNYEIEEAVNGIEGLTKFSENTPDVILLDVAMPLMNGKEFLEAIRSDPESKDVFVIVLTALGDKHIVKDMIELGISDYMLKPFNIDDIVTRVSAITEKIRMLTRRKLNIRDKVDSPLYSKKILLVNKDTQFHQFFEMLFGDRFTIINGENGAECLQHYLNHKPEIIVLGDGLSIINERLLAKKIRELDAEGHTELFLCSDRSTFDPTKYTDFDQIIRKSFIPHIFLKEFSYKALGLKTIHEILTGIIQNMKTQFSAAVIQTLGVATTQDIRIIDQKEIPFIPEEIVASVDNIEFEDKVTFSVHLIGSQIDVVSIIKRKSNNDFTFDKGVIAALSEHIVTISNRIRTIILEKGIRSEQLDVRVRLKPDDMNTLFYEIKIPFETQSNWRFLACISISSPEYSKN